MVGGHDLRPLSAAGPARKLLILDLDETLVFATETPLDRPEAFVVGPYRVYLRPHVAELVAVCVAHFDVAVWTASSDPYARAVVARLFEHASPCFL